MGYELIKYKVKVLFSHQLLTPVLREEIGRPIPGVRLVKDA